VNGAQDAGDLISAERVSPRDQSISDKAGTTKRPRRQRGDAAGRRI